MSEPRILPAERVSAELPILAVTDDGLGNTSWVLALDGDGVVVDPERDPIPYEAAAEQLGASIVLAAETHLHADFVTGSRELAAAHGASVAASAAGEVAWPHQAVTDGDELDFGRWRIRALATPGHTPEHLAYVLVEDGRARAVFTGGSLMVGSVARTDLIDPADTEALTRALWRSINHQLLVLPDDVLVLPTHGAGSFCAAGAGGPRWTTIGQERASNPLLQADDEDEFVRLVLAGFGSYPPYFTRLREVNRLGPHVYGTMPALPSLGPDRALELRASGAVIVDARPVDSYAAGHIPASLANTLRPQFASWLGWLVEDPTLPLAFVVDGHTDQRELVRQCLNIGYENLAGTIDMATWEAAGAPVATTALVGPNDLEGCRIVDVRQANEFAAGHVPDAVHVELGALAGRTGAVGDGPTVTMCGHGERAATAASVLEAAGYDDVAVLDGGPGDWAAAANDELVRR
jgi:glyoxylase-like metal-dependent hydrolase (beta-lactamase superfamily II)/rhodanese-related sulfurtransferase